MRIAIARSDADIAATYDVMAQLRPHIAREDYVPRVRALMQSDGFLLAALIDEEVVRAVAGFRVMTMLCCGRILYIDDLVTDERVRSTGYGAALLDWLKEEGRRRECDDLHLISRVTREQAHRFYFREGLSIMCFHFRTGL